MKVSKLITAIPVVAAVASAMCLGGCNKADADTAPVLDGVETIDCLVKQYVDILDTVRATDAEDGDISGNIGISISGVTVTNGVVYFDEPGEYTAALSVRDSDGNLTEDSLKINVHPRAVYKSFPLEQEFYVLSTGSAAIDSGVVGGKYRIKATGVAATDGISLVRTFPAEKNVESSIVYKFNSDVAGSAKIVIDGNETAVDVAVGSNNVSVDYTATGDTVTAALKLDGLAAEFEINVFSVKITVPGDEYVEYCGSDFEFDPASITTDYNADFIDAIESGTAKDGSFAYMTVTPGSDERAAWYAKLFVHTGIQLKSGYKYKVGFTAQAEHAQEFSVAFNARKLEYKSADKEHSMGGLYLPADTPRTFTYDDVIVPESDRGELWLQINFGAVPEGFDANTITVTDISVGIQKAGVYSFSDTGFTGKSAEEKGARGNVVFEKGKIIYNVEKFSSTTDWANEISSRPFSVEDTGETFVMTFRAKATHPTVVTFVIPTYGGWDPTLTWQHFRIGTEETEYRFLIDGVAEKGPYFLVFQFGFEENAGLGPTVIEISDIGLELMSAFDSIA